MLVGHEQPAGDEDRRGSPRAACRAEVDEAWKTLNEADGLVPYIDYATPTFYDDISAAIQKLLAGKAAAAASSRRACEKDYTKFTGSLGRSGSTGREPAAPPTAARAGGRAAARRAPAGRATSTSCRALAVFAAFVLAAADPRGLDLAVRVGRHHRRASGSALDNYRRSSPTRTLRAAFVHALVLLIFYAGAADRDRAAARGGDVARAGARAGGVPHDPVPAAGDRARRRRRDVADDLRARRRPDQRRAGRDRARRAGAGLARRLHARAARRRADRDLGDVRAGDGAVHRRRAEDPAVALRRRARRRRRAGARVLRRHAARAARRRSRSR